MWGEVASFPMLFWRRASLLVMLAMIAGPCLAQETAAASKGKTEHILAVSWQPGFCETRPNRKECSGQTAKRYDATHFSLHGLWPMKKSYCGVTADMRARDRKGDWLDLPKPAMGEEIAEKLLITMPGTQSGLDRHQWLRSGTCQGGTAEVYFARQLSLLDELNGSAVRALFAGRLGAQVTEAEIKRAFDASFGKGAGERVRMRCQKAGARNVITGLTIGLAGDLSKGVGLSDLMLAAGSTDFKCGQGIVDAAGIQ